MKWNEVFDVVEDVDEVGEVYAGIQWTTESGNVRKARLSFIEATFGPTVQSYESLIAKAPSDGWKDNIKQWRELGIIQ